jgi:hypothetical protein
VGDGATILFWLDNWFEGKSLEEIAPDLVTTVSRHAVRSCRVASAMTNHTWITDITGVLSIPVLVQCLELHQQLG